MSLSRISSVQLHVSRRDHLRRSFIKNVYQSVVHVKVGRELKDFVVHKYLICYWSRYFRTAFTSNFQEAAESTIELPNVEEEVFALYVHWLYNQQLMDGDLRHDFEAQYKLLKLYVLAYDTHVKALKNAAINALAECINLTGFQFTSLLSYVWDSTPRRCRLQRFLVDQIVWPAEHSIFKTYSEDFTNHKLCIDIMTAMKRKDSEQLETSPLDDITNYHELLDT